MKTRKKEKGSALVMVLVISSVTMLVLASILQWTGTNNRLSQRNNEYYKTVAAAEAATEKVIARLASDYQLRGESLVFANLDAYRNLVPSSTESPRFGAYQFADGEGNQNRTYTQFLPPSEYRVLNAQYKGLYGYASKFRIISNARETTSSQGITAAVWQEVDVATIPFFQFAIFYNLDLEINPGPVMTVDGPVHSNQNMYLEPQATLTFQDEVTAAGEMFNREKPGDPTVRTPGPIVFNDEHDSGVSSLNLPIATNNSSGAVREVIKLPAVDESPTSPMGKERFYNKADMIIRVSPSGTTVTSGILNNRGTVVPQGQWDSTLNSGGGFLTVGTSFFNKRENKTVSAIQLDIAKLVKWNETNTLLRSVIPGNDVSIVYVSDERTHTTTQTGVRVVNGELLPPDGLTVATPSPIYVKGNYNVKNSPSGSSSAGTLNTANTRPAALIGDAVTVLSGAWSDANSTLALTSRTATDTTVNAAFLAGIVQTTTGQYSGGVENFPRFLENWSGRNFYYSGSMVVMYDSERATGQWAGTGTTIGIYNPPNRYWAFDKNFRDPAKLPPGTPSGRVLVRGNWAMVKPNTTTVVLPN